MMNKQKIRELHAALEKLPTSRSTSKQRVIEVQEGYSERELEHFRTLLQQMKDEILEEIREMRDPATEVEYAERAAILHSRSNMLDGIERALERIEHGRYGWCTSCGEVIEKGRLEAIPFTQLCISCKSGAPLRREERGARGQAA
ncbi:MAG TPA: TraR/DksA C4-type zinc finger protein [Bacteroidota bacterium]|nr:TraR/DksA C4-type zinc finger protein [Bacteroidota bacterium]